MTKLVNFGRSIIQHKDPLFVEDLLLQPKYDHNLSLVNLKLMVLLLESRGTLVQNCASVFRISFSNYTVYFSVMLYS